MDRPVLGSIIGKGVYGTVYTKETESGRCVTKKLERSTDGITRDAARELHALFLMKELKDVVRVLKVTFELTTRGETLISIDFEHYTSDLYKFIETVDFRERLASADILIPQLLHGLHALYQRGIIHRDIKPENILVQYQYDTHVNKLIGTPRCVIADFGLSRQLLCNHQQDETKMTAAVYSPWYRPPELLIDHQALEKFYTYNADVWAMGATIAEYYAGSPLFAVKNYTNGRISEMIKGSLKSDGTTVDLIPFYKRHLHRHHIKIIPDDAILQTEKMLTYDWKVRPSIDQVIDHPILVGKAMPPLSRGELKIHDRTYHDLINKMFDHGLKYQLEPVTMINAIGMLERYLANCHPQDEEMIPLVVVITISLSILINEIRALTMTDYYEMAGQKYSLQVMKEAQIIIASKLKYCFSSCEVDVFLLMIVDQPKPMAALRNTYLGLMADGYRPQMMSYHELAAAVPKYGEK
ncbi:Cyclin-dependent kinase 4 [uncultured virus]|nr:Cyclin-dependent kinase 4 [uncultured virus]